MMKNLIILAAAAAAMAAGTDNIQAQSKVSTDWPTVNQVAKPGTRWWWLGSAVDSTNLTYNLETYAKAGIGAVEITPIYGVIGNEKNEIDFLSDRWMRMLRHTEAEGKRLGIIVDMNTGTGWPFGGPEVSMDEAASKLSYHVWKVGEEEPEFDAKEKKNQPNLLGRWTYGDTLNIALYSSHTRQAVKRAAPGGEGYVMDHLNPKAVNHYFERFTEAFKRTGTPAPNSFFNDSYEVYGADWTPAMLEEFEARRGYKLQDYLPAFICETDTTHRLLTQDYRETMSDLLLEVFTHSWADWAHRMGSTVRNQAHGSPADLLDVYAAVDIPEIEGFGLSDFKINGLRTDSMWRHNDSDLSMLKYASSAAHVTGKPIVSSETFTWLTEHFRTSLSQCKPDFDLMQIGGVNHCYFHGTTYSPQEYPWPGHLFYASMEMSPINTIWRDAPAFMQYMTRVQSFMQYGEPDNDLLLYMPVYDAWFENSGRLLMFAIHGMQNKAPRFVEAVNTIYNEGYDMDYMSDRMLQATKVAADGSIVTSGGTRYKALILPGVLFMKPETMQHIIDLANQGATVMFVGGVPTQVPGMYNREERMQQLAEITAKLPANVLQAPDYKSALPMLTKVQPEGMKAKNGAKCIRRRNETGYHYFISSLQAADIDDDVELAIQAKSAIIYDALTGKRGIAAVSQRNGKTCVHLQLASGQSCILKTFTDMDATALKAADPSLQDWTYLYPTADPAIDLSAAKWTLDVSELDNAKPLTQTEYKLSALQPWTAIEALRNTKGTATYTTTVKLNKKQLAAAQDWMLDLGDVRESAHIYVNGQDAGTAFSVPYRINIGQYLKAGKNEIRIEVTGLCANYVAQMDRDGVKWRNFKNANIATLPGYHKDKKYDTYAWWGTIPCGLNSDVKLIPLKSK
ncbi:MAG: glycosyl hydrolase family 2 [Bacteroidales bacterium]|nr:glycosyl hydrolase family 2 [Bacteroidales bacterium]